MSEIETFPSREALYEAAASALVNALTGGIAAKGVASLALAGGSTPAPVYRLLNQAALDWSKVHDEVGAALADNGDHVAAGVLERKRPGGGRQQDDGSRQRGGSSESSQECMNHAHVESLLVSPPMHSEVGGRV